MKFSLDTDSYSFMVIIIIACVYRMNSTKTLKISLPTAFTYAHTCMQAGIEFMIRCIDSNTCIATV